MDRQQQRFTRADRCGAASGAGYLLAINVGNGFALAGQSQGTDAASILADVRAPRTAANVVGICLELGGFLAFIVFVAWLVGYLRASSRPGAATPRSPPRSC